MLHQIIRTTACALLIIFAQATLSQTVRSLSLPASASSGSAVPAETAEVRILQARLDDAQKHQDQMLASVWGALGTIATLAALLVGFGWFANVRMYERDKSALEQSLRATLLDDQRRAREELIASLQQSSDALRTELASDTEKLRAESLKDIESASKRISGELEKQVRSLKSDITVLKQETLKFQMRDAFQLREEAVRQKVWRNALQDSVTALEIAKQIDDDEYSVGDALDLVSTDIDSILGDPTCRIDNYLLAQVSEELGSLKGRHSTAARALLAKASKMKIGG